jgi:hypothetical protein
MAPQPIAGAEEEEDSSYSVDGDDSSAAAATPLLNLRFYPSGGSDEEDTVEKLLFEDAHEGDDDSDVHFVMASREKVVKFADDVAEQRDARRDKERSRGELLAKIARLTDMLKDAEKAVDVEKEKRKKKEKNLLKLAKELKKRNQKRESDLERMEEVRPMSSYLRYPDINFMIMCSHVIFRFHSWRRRNDTWNTIGFSLKRSWIKRKH